MKTLEQKELVEINGGWEEGSFLDIIASKASQGYRDFKDFLRDQGVLPKR